MAEDSGSKLTGRFVVGIVRGTHGITGEFKVESTSGEYEHFARMKEVTLTDGNAEKPYSVEYVHEAADTLYMKLMGINTPEDAAKFNRWEIVVPREYAHQLQKGEWYIEDLKGCSVWYKGDVAAEAAPALSENDIVGIVTDVKEGGSGYLVEISLSEGCTLIGDGIKYTKGGKLRTVYVPFKNEFIGDVDVVAKKMQLMHLWILE